MLQHLKAGGRPFEGGLADPEGVGAERGAQPADPAVAQRGEVGHGCGHAGGQVEFDGRGAAAAAGSASRKTAGVLDGSSPSWLSSGEQISRPSNRLVVAASARVAAFQPELTTTASPCRAASSSTPVSTRPKNGPCRLGTASSAIPLRPRRSWRPAACGR